MKIKITLSLLLILVIVSCLYNIAHGAFSEYGTILDSVDDSYWFDASDAYQNPSKGIEVYGSDTGNEKVIVNSYYSSTGGDIVYTYGITYSGSFTGTSIIDSLSFTSAPDLRYGSIVLANNSVNPAVYISIGFDDSANNFIAKSFTISTTGTISAIIDNETILHFDTACNSTDGISVDPENGIVAVTLFGRDSGHYTGSVISFYVASDGDILEGGGPGGGSAIDTISMFHNFPKYYGSCEIFPITQNLDGLTPMDRIGPGWYGVIGGAYSTESDCAIGTFYTDVNGNLTQGDQKSAIVGSIENVQVDNTIYASPPIRLYGTTDTWIISSEEYNTTFTITNTGSINATALDQVKWKTSGTSTSPRIYWLDGNYYTVQYYDGTQNTFAFFEYDDYDLSIGETVTESEHPAAFHITTKNAKQLIPCGNYATYVMTGAQNVGDYDQIGFTFWFDIPDAAPTVTTSCASSVTGESATFNGNITNLGNNDVTLRGFLYSDSGTPTESDSIISESSSGFSTGIYSLDADDLESSTDYYVRAFAYSASGTGYGSVISFSTVLPSPETDYSDHPYYVRIDATNTGESTITNERILAPIDSLYLVENNFCQSDASDLVATQSTEGIDVTATFLSGTGSYWQLPRVDFESGETISDLIWMGSGTTNRDQLWQADANDSVYAVRDTSQDALNTLLFTGMVEPLVTPTNQQTIIEKPGNYSLVIDGTPAYVFTVYRGNILYSDQAKDPLANGYHTGIETYVGGSSRVACITDASDTSYLQESRFTTGHYDLYTITPEIPPGSIISSVTINYRYKISSDCAGDPSAHIQPIIYSKLSGIISGTEVYASTGLIISGSQTFTDQVSSDLQIGVDMLSDSNCSESTKCYELSAEVTYKAPASSHSVTISATIDQGSAIEAGYTGSLLYIQDLATCQYESTALSGTLTLSLDPLYAFEFDGNINTVSLTTDGSQKANYEFEPLEITKTVILDKTANDNDLIYSLSAMNGDISVTVNPLTTYIPSYYSLSDTGTASGIGLHIPTEPENLTGDSDTFDHFPGSGFINGFLETLNVSVSAFWYTFWLGWVIGLGFYTYKKSGDIVSIIVSIVVVIIFQALARMGLGYIDIVLLFVCLFASYSRREFSRGYIQ